MKKATFLLVLMGVLIFPSTTFAFSFFDVFRFFSSEKKVESNTEVFTEEDKAIAEQKFKAWKEAYDNDNIKRVFRNERNFVLGEQEANYLADLLDKVVTTANLS